MRTSFLSSAFHRLLQYQSHVTASFRPFQQYAGMAAPPPSASSHEDPDISRVLTFWFRPPGIETMSLSDQATRWMRSNASLDIEIRDNFLPLIASARDTALLDSWTSTPRGTLALLLLLDQFPRNVYRGDPLAFASDKKALAVASQAILKRQDRDKGMGFLEQQFIYLPVMHEESLVGQVASVSLYQDWLDRQNAATSSPPEEKSEASAPLDSQVPESAAEVRGAPEPSLEERRQYAGIALWHANMHAETILRFGRYPGRNRVLGRENTPEEEDFLKEFPHGLPFKM